MPLTRSIPLFASLLLATAALAGGVGSSTKKKQAREPTEQTARENAPAANEQVETREGKRRGRPARPHRGLAVPSAVREAAAGDIELGEPVRYHNISLVPVLTRKTGPFQRYSLLEEGLRGGSFEVRELKGTSGEAQVNQVEVRNEGGDPVYLLGGEMILGGKQDRIISRDTVVPPSGKWTRVSVFCVEQGRWHGQRMKFQAGSAIADLSIQRAAMKDSQSEVWKEVSRKNVLHGTQSSTQTYRRTIQNAELRRKIGPYVSDLSAKLPDGGRLAGVVFGINGKVHVADIFGNPGLFGKLADKLLSAYVLEALAHQVDRNAVPVSADRAKAFIDEGRKAKAKAGKTAGRAIGYGKETDNLIGTETVDQQARGKGPVRETYIAK